MNTKTCTKCGIDKPLNDYHNRKDSKDGKPTDCTEMRNAAKKAWVKPRTQLVHVHGQKQNKHGNATPNNLNRLKALPRQQTKNTRSRAWAEKQTT